MVLISTFLAFFLSSLSSSFSRPISCTKALPTVSVSALYPVNSHNDTASHVTKRTSNFYTQGRVERPVARGGGVVWAAGIAQDAAEDRDDEDATPRPSLPTSLHASRKHTNRRVWAQNSRLNRTAAGSNGLLRVAGLGKAVAAAHRGTQWRRWRERAADRALRR